MTWLFLFVSLLAPCAQAEPELRFSYVPNEGAAAAQCTHERIRDLPDWQVTCPFFGEKKIFTAHVIVRERPRPDQNFLEILYWVSAPGRSTRFHSTSALLKINGPGRLDSLSLAQGVENDYASLVLEARGPVAAGKIALGR